MYHRQVFKLLILISLSSLASLAYSNIFDASSREELRSPKGTAPFNPSVYSERREQLMNALGQGVVMIKSAPNIQYEKQNADFAYLTGIVDEADAVLVLFKNEQDTYKEYLFLSQHVPESDVWYGERLPIGQEIRNRTGIQVIRRINSLQSILPQLAAKAGVFHFLGPLVGHESAIPWVLDTMRKVSARVPGVTIKNSYSLLPMMRSIKERRELELMEKAIKATSAAHKAVLKNVKPGLFEYDLQDIIEATFRQHGAHELAFNSIIGSGPNSSVLHYLRNDRKIMDGDIVLIDIGAEYQHYASDITRTFPANGKFTPRQRDIYNIVLEAQMAAVNATKAGVFRDEISAAAIDVFEKYGVRDYFLHGIGHFVGLQVHDAGDYLQPLPVGAVITIEPGIYIPDEEIGVRIEDQYLITETGVKHLTKDLPRTAQEIEAFMVR